MALVVPLGLARRPDEEHAVAVGALLDDHGAADDGLAIDSGPAAHGGDDQSVARLGDHCGAQLETGGEHLGQHHDVGIGGRDDRFETLQVAGGVLPLHVDLAKGNADFHIGNGILDHSKINVFSQTRNPPAKNESTVKLRHNKIKRTFAT